MTERHMAYVVLLDREVREDDAESIITALSMVKGVGSVSPMVANMETELSHDRARRELMIELVEFVKGWRKGKAGG